MTASRRRPWFAGLLVLIGGAVIASSALLPWFDTGGINMGENDISGTPTGLELQFGTYLVAAGAVVAGVGILALLIGRARRILGVVAILGAIAAGYLVWLVWDEPEDAYRTFVADELGVDAEDLDSLNELFEAGLLDATLQPVVYGAVAGAGLALIGGVLLLFGRGRAREAKHAVTTEPAAAAALESFAATSQLTGSDAPAPPADTEVAAEHDVPEPSAGTAPEQLDGSPDWASPGRGPEPRPDQVGAHRESSEGEPDDEPPSNGADEPGSRGDALGDSWSG